MSTDPILDRLAARAAEDFARLPRRVRRAAWRGACKQIGRKLPWRPIVLDPLHQQLLSGRNATQVQLEVSLGFNRAQRRAIRAKSGPKRPVCRWHRQPDGLIVPRYTQSFGWDKFVLRHLLNQGIQWRVKDYLDRQDSLRARVGRTVEGVKLVAKSAARSVRRFFKRLGR